MAQSHETPSPRELACAWFMIAYAQANSLAFRHLKAMNRQLNHHDATNDFSHLTRHAIENATRVLLVRVENSHAVDANVLLPRVEKIVCKYLLRHNPHASANDIENFVQTLHAEDLCLVVACEQGDDAAWRELMKNFKATVQSAARAATGNATDAEELAQSVWAELHGFRQTNDVQNQSTNIKTTGKLAYYSGCGSLGGYLRAVVSQLAIDNHRRANRFVQLENQSDFDFHARRDAQKRESTNDDHHAMNNMMGNVMSNVALNPEIEFARKERASVLQAAMTEAMNQIATEDLLLVKLYYFDDLSLKEAGAVLNFHEATASRRLARVHKNLRANIEQILREQHRWQDAEIESAFHHAGDVYDFDVRRMLINENADDDAPNATLSETIN